VLFRSTLQSNISLVITVAKEGLILN